MNMTTKIKRDFLMAFLSLIIVGLSGCASLHDGEGLEHEPGESKIKHKH